MTLELIPWDVRDSEGMSIIMPGMDHIGFKVESLDALKEDIDAAAANPQLRPVGLGLGALVEDREAEQVGVEFRHGFRVHGAQGDVIDGAVLLPFLGGVQIRAVGHVLLGDVEHVAVGIMGGDAGKGPRAGAPTMPISTFPTGA